jgi:hypothetical protein
MKETSNSKLNTVLLGDKSIQTLSLDKLSTWCNSLRVRAYEENARVNPINIQKGRGYELWRNKAAVI